MTPYNPFGGPPKPKKDKGATVANNLGQAANNVGQAANTVANNVGQAANTAINAAGQAANDALNAANQGKAWVGQQMHNLKTDLRRGFEGKGVLRTQDPDRWRVGTKTWAPGAETEALKKNHPMYAPAEEETTDPQQPGPQQPQQPQPWEPTANYATPREDPSNWVTGPDGKKRYKDPSGSATALGTSYTDPNTKTTINTRYDSRFNRDFGGNAREQERAAQGANLQGMVPTFGDVDGKFQLTGMRPMDPFELAEQRSTPDEMARTSTSDPNKLPGQEIPVTLPDYPAPQYSPPQQPTPQQPTQESSYVVDHAAEAAKNLAMNPFMPFQKGLEGLSSLSESGGLGGLADRAIQAMGAAPAAPEAPQVPQAAEPTYGSAADYYMGDYSHDPETNPYAPVPGTVPEQNFNQPEDALFSSYSPPPVTNPELLPEEAFDPSEYELDPEFMAEEEAERRRRMALASRYQ